MPRISKQQIDTLRHSIDAMVRVFNISDKQAPYPGAPKFNISDTQALLYIGNNPDCINTDLVHWLSVAPTSVTTIVDRLTKQNIVLRKRSEDNRRVVHLQLTTLGEQVREAIIQRQNDHCQLMLSLLTTEERKAFIQSMNKIAHNITS